MKLDRGNSVEAAVRGAVKRLQRLDEEIRALNENKGDIYAEVKRAGIPPANVRAALGYLRDPEKAQERTAGMVEVLRMLGEPIEPPAAQLQAPEPVLDTGIDLAFARAPARGADA